MTNKK